MSPNNSERAGSHRRVVSAALEKATLLRGQAKAASVGDVSKWPHALAAVNEAKSASMRASQPKTSGPEWSSCWRPWIRSKPMPRAAPPNWTGIESFWNDWMQSDWHLR